MAWLKALHIIFMVTWFAGLFYLPRLFVYHAQTDDAAGQQRFKVMERKLFAIMSLGAVMTAVFGFSLLYAGGLALYMKAGWMHAKLTLVLLLVGYHYWCGHLIAQFRDGRNAHGHVWYRWFNEVPAVALIGIVILVVVRPF